MLTWGIWKNLMQENFGLIFRSLSKKIIVSRLELFTGAIATFLRNHLRKRIPCHENYSLGSYFFITQHGRVSVCCLRSHQLHKIILGDFISCDLHDFTVVAPKSYIKILGLRKHGRESQGCAPRETIWKKFPRLAWAFWPRRWRGCWGAGQKGLNILAISGQNSWQNSCQFPVNSGRSCCKSKSHRELPP